MIYLDEAATSKPKNAVIQAMLPYLYDNWYNPSSLYSKAFAISKKIDGARETIAKLIHANPNEIYFTSGGSESNSWAIQGFAKQARKWDTIPLIITTNIEHSSINRCIKDCEYHHRAIPVDSFGLINLSDLEDVLLNYEIMNTREREINGKTYNILLSVQMANNEIGVIQNIKAVSEICHRYNAYLHVDAVQTFGKIPINVKDMGIDLLSASGHKIGCPKGIGFLYKRNSVIIDPIIHGTQECGIRGGTENVAGIMALKRAVEITQKDTHYELRMSVLRNNFISELEAMGCTLNGHREQRLPNNINVILPEGVSAESMIYLLDASDIYVSAGSACNAQNHSASKVLKAIGLTDEEALRTIRITLPDDITMDEIDIALDEIKKALVILNG